MALGLKGLAAVPAEPIPLSVLTGFLGSGKTTFCRPGAGELPDLRDTAVVISEFGAVALDHLLLEATAEDVVELPNGCTCCAVRQGLADTLLPAGRSRQRQRTAAVPAHRAGDQRPGRSRPGPLHAVGRRLSRGVAAARSRRDDGRCHRRPGDARALSRGDGAGSQSPTCCCSPRPTSPAAPETARARLAALNPIARRRRRRGDAMRPTLLFGGRPSRLAAAAPARRGDSCPRHPVACRCDCSGR